MTHFVQSRWLYLFFVVIVGGVAGGWFQAAQQTSTEVPAPTIRVTTHLVLIDAVVTDKQGNPIAGLHPEDFVVEENGKAQKIATFAGPLQSASGPASLPPGIYSNRSQYRSTGGPVTVMLLDAINTPFSDQAYARRQMLNFVQDQYKPDQRMAVFTLTGSLNVLQDFTTDPQILYAALQRFRPRPQEFASAGRATTSATAGDATTASTVASLDASTAPATDTSGLGPGAAQLVAAAQAAAQSFEAAQVAYAQEQRTMLTLQALNSLGRILGGLPGRKNIIWVTGNLPFSLIPENRNMTNAELEESLPSQKIRSVDQHSAGNYAATFRQAHADEIRETAARLASAQVAVYPVDARGLSISTSIEIKYGVERAFKDEAATYTLGYYPENKKWDGKYRSIKVKVKRDGTEVQNRRGYFAIDPTQMKGYSQEQEVASALRDVVPATLVGFSARVRPSSANSTPGKVGVDFLVDANTLSAEDTSGGKRLNVAFYATVFSPHGKMLVERSQKVDQSFNGEVYRQIVEKGLLLHIDLDPQPGNNRLRLAVQDNKTGLVGTIDPPLGQ